MFAIIALTLSGRFRENHTHNDRKSHARNERTERIALGLRTRDGISASELKDFSRETDELIGLELLRKSNGNFVLTRRGKSLADSITEAFL